MRKKPDWLKLFETARDDDEQLTVQESVRLFIAEFPLQSGRYRLVWAIRLLCWVLLIVVFFIGLFVRIKQYFK